MKKRYIGAFLAAAAAGALLHFAYDVLPVPLVGLFAPVNESVWEHLKLLFWPMLAAGFILCRKKPDQMRAWSGFLAALLLMPLGLLGIYYLLAAGFGVTALWIDLALYYLTLAGGFYLAYAMEKSGKWSFLSGVMVLLVGLYGAALILFTLAPPELPIFIAPGA